MKKLIIIFLFLSRNIFGHGDDSLYHHKLAIIGGVNYWRLPWVRNFGEFEYRKSNHNAYLNPFEGFALGIKYQNITFVYDYTVGSFRGNDWKRSWNENGFQFWIDLLYKHNMIVKPVIGIEYLFEKYKSYDDREINWNVGQLNSPSQMDRSKNRQTGLLQIPIGAYFERKNLLISFTLNIPVYGWIKGSDTYQYGISWRNPDPPLTTHTYSESLHQFLEERIIFDEYSICFKIAYKLNFRWK